MNKDILNLLKEHKKKQFANLNFTQQFKLAITHETSWEIWKYIECLYYSKYYKNTNRIISKFKHLKYRIKKNKLGLKLSIEMHEDSIADGLIIYHGNIVINKNAKIGKNCRLHGMNCIGNNGKNDLCPIIGDNVEIGSGAQIIGNVKVGSNVIIGSGTVVVKDIPNNCVVVGNPARILKKG